MVQVPGRESMVLAIVVLDPALEATMVVVLVMVTMVVVLVMATMVVVLVMATMVVVLAMVWVPATVPTMVLLHPRLAH